MSNTFHVQSKYIGHCKNVKHSYLNTRWDSMVTKPCIIPEKYLLAVKLYI